MKRRFEVRSVDEQNRDKISLHPSEIIPLINVPNEIPSSLPFVPHFTTINETTKTTIEPSDHFLKSSNRNSSTDDLTQSVRSSLPTVNSTTVIGATKNGKIEDIDSNYSTMNSNNYDTNSFRFTDKFLYELRLKRRELRDKTKNIPIEQRIALSFYDHAQNRLRAQDIFDVHFELNDIDDIQENVFNENSQETIRKNIFNELDRQRTKQYNKQYRQLLFGRTLLIVFISLLAFMSITLVYVVIDLYDRAKYLDIAIPDNKFVSMIYDKTKDI